MFTYTLMNLVKSPLRSLQLFASCFLVFMLILLASSFQESMSSSLKVNSDDKNVILLGAGSEESLERSEVHQSAIAAARTIPGLKKSFDASAVSPEIHYNSVLQFDGIEKEALIRGVQKTALNVYPALELTEGHFPHSGQMMIGRFAWKRLGLNQDQLKIGKSIVFEKQEFIVSGIFAAPGTLMESEIWMNLNDMISLTQRDSISSITLRLDQAEYDDIDLFAKQRLDLQLAAISEQDYYAKVSSFYEPIQFMAWLTALLIASGALFGGLNTFYAAIESRKKELATLQAIGFQRSKLMMSLYAESALIHLSAFLVAISTALYFFPLVSINFGSTFFTLGVSHLQIFYGFALALVLAFAVIILPGWHCLHPALNNTLND
ncbi:FtsX-like permease family protein [Lentisphaera profundi]|uniref:FtsX-like permease family protein n=1 Tax=Lentisphaera profundi TaxID=1658616 RepID=A0ABY7VWI1_9BACT|nr:ABC transporter permease [Lentisphaera profundi]WDE97555.1 FtsX-like permease family protein [Lentisphaera profundi]